jgi:hypothetical protein
MAVRAKIYKPAKSTMQSGRADRGWLLEYTPQSARVPEPLMGWLSSEDTLNQVKLRFDKMEDAVAFAEEQGMEYEVSGRNVRRIVPRNYTDNFRYFPDESEK